MAYTVNLSGKETLTANDVTIGLRMQFTVDNEEEFKELVDKFNDPELTQFIAISEEGTPNTVVYINNRYAGAQDTPGFNGERDVHFVNIYMKGETNPGAVSFIDQKQLQA